MSSALGSSSARGTKTTEVEILQAAGGSAFLLLRCRALDRVWLLEDLDALSRRERVRVRGRADGGDGESRAIPHVLPVLEPSPLADVARGIRPYWDYLRLVTQAS